MQEEHKNKLHITPKGNRFTQRQPSNTKDLEECKQEIKRIKKQLSRLIHLAEHEENVLENYQGKTVELKLSDGTREEGILHKITKFQLVLKDNDDTERYFYKSGIIKYQVSLK